MKSRPIRPPTEPADESPEGRTFPETFAPQGELEPRFRALQIAGVQKYTPIMMLGNVVNAGLFVWAAARADLMTFALPWLTLILLYSATAMRSWRRSRQLPVRHVASTRAIRRAVVNAAVLGAFWGLAALLIYPAADPQGQTVVAVITGGMIYGGGFALSAMPPAMNAYLAPLVICSFAALALNQQPIDVVLGIPLLVFSFIIQRAGVGLGSLLRTNFEDREQIAEQSKVIGLLLHDFERNTNDWLWEVDEGGRLRRGVEQTSKAINVPLDVLRQSDFRKLTDDCCNDPDCHSELLQQHLRNGTPFRGVEVHFPDEHDPRWLRLSGHPLRDATGTLVGFRGVASNISAERSAKQWIAYLARHDALTGLLNRSSFADALDELFTAHRAHAADVCLLYLDLDGFKEVNDRRGHTSGDRLLVDISHRLSDATGGAGAVARIGGDEFAVLLRDVERQTAVNLAAHLIQTVGQPLIIDGDLVRIGVSIGIAFAGPNTSTPEALVSAADTALYRAKENGKNSSLVFDADMHATRLSQQELRQDLNFAIERNELELCYQPIVLANSGDVRGFEALLRWRHPVRGMLSPGEFLDHAEAGGMVHDIGRWVLREACRTAVAWPPQVFVSVNLSPEQLLAPDLPAAIDRAIESSGLDPRRLQAELTENVLIEDVVAVADNISALKALGVTVALDDFGKGYSGFGYLADLGIDTLKIDRSLVANCDSDDRARKVLEAIMLMGRALELETTAEGVETPEQAAVMQSLGCNFLQGYFFARPLSQDQVLEYFER